MIKKIKTHSSTVLLLIILVILVVPSWRVSFQGWVQSFWMDEIEFTSNNSVSLSPATQLWNLSNMEGEDFLFSSFKNKPIILSFWATWCPSCRAELGELKSLKEEYADKIHVLAVSEEPIETIRKSKLHSEYSFLYRTSYFPEDFNIQVYPTLFILNKGSILNRFEGAGDLDTEKNRKFLNGLIENR